MRLSSLSIAIACYNDAGTIAALVEQSAAVAAGLAERFRILVVDDGSSDGSPEILRVAASRHDWLEVRIHPQNQGFGGTFGELYTYSGCEFNAILPGDGQIEPSQVAVMAEAMGESDVVLGIRRVRKDSLHRRVNSALYNFVISIAAGRNAGDVNSISLARTNLVRGLHLSSRSAFVHAEFLLECYRAGARVRKVRIEHRPRMHGAGAGARIGVIGPTVRELGFYVLRKGPAWTRPRQGSST